MFEVLSLLITWRAASLCELMRTLGVNYVLLCGLRRVRVLALGSRLRFKFEVSCSEPAKGGSSCFPMCTHVNSRI
jgi:hypothetical protein